MRESTEPRVCCGLRRAAAVLLVAGAFAVLFAAMTPGVAFAQGDAAAADSAAGGDATGGTEISALWWVIRALKWHYSIIFLSLSFTLVALIVMNVLQASRSNVAPTDLVEGFEEHLNAKQYTEAYELANGDDSFLGKVLSAGLSKLSGGGDYSHAVEAMQEVGEEENMKLEHRLSYMALIGTISPMIGLLGTVQGMMSAFYEIQRSNTGAPNASALAGDIATALVTTFAGLFIAIPAIAAYNILRNRIARLVLEVGIVSEGLMSRFQNVGKKQE